MGTPKTNRRQFGNRRWKRKQQKKLFIAFVQLEVSDWTRTETLDSWIILR